MWLALKMLLSDSGCRKEIYIPESLVQNSIYLEIIYPENTNENNIKQNFTNLENTNKNCK